MAYVKVGFRRQKGKAFYRKGSSKNTAAKAVRKARTHNFNKRVLKVLNRASETKMKVVSVVDGHSIYGQGLLSTSQNQGSGHSGYIVPNLLSSIALDQGTEQEQRVGNKIQNAKLTISGVLKSNVYDATTNPYLSPFEVHMVVYKSKNDTQGNPLQIKAKPANTIGPADGTLENTLYPYNRDKYMIHKVRVFRLRGYRAHIDGSQNPTDTQVLGGQSGNLAAFARFRCDIPISNTLLYNDGASVANNSWATVGFYVVDCQNNTITSTHTRCELWLDAKLTFKDV